MIILTAIRSVVFDILFFVWSLLISIVAAILGYIAPRAWLVWWSALWARGCSVLESAILGLHYKMTGKENFPPAPFIAAFQHQSLWETPKLLYWFKSPAVVMKAELLTLPFWGHAVQSYGCIPVARTKRPEDLLRFVSIARQMAADQRPIILFPQGTRTAPGKAVKLNRGVAVLYEELNIPVVPVTLDSGTYWPRKAFLKKPGTVNLVVHPPIAPGLSREELLARLAALYEAG